jgi:hypothetical protein
MKKLMFIFIIGIALFSCQSEVVNINEEKSEVAKASLLRQNEKAPQSSASFNINLGVFDWDKKIATFTIGHTSGCDPNFNFKFYLKPRATNVCGGIDTVFVVLNTNVNVVSNAKSNCESSVNTLVTFDFSPFISCTDKIVFVGGIKILEFSLKPAISTTQYTGITHLGANDKIPQSDGQFNIDKSFFDWDNKVATFTISHSGGCDPNYNFKFYYKPKLTLDCLVDTVHVVLSTKDNCKRLDNTVVNFDLKTLTMCSKKIVFKGGTKIFEVTR